MVTDSCPNCLARHIMPAALRHGRKAVRYGYQCYRCQTAWATDYSEQPYGIPNEWEPEQWSA